MTTEKKVEKKSPDAKELMLQHVSQQLQSSLVALKTVIGEKKFEKRIKKVAKILVAGIKETAVKKAVTVPKKIVGATKKAAAPVKKAASSVTKVASPVKKAVKKTFKKAK